MTPELLGMRYRGAPHVESWFVKVNEPGGRRAVWIRTTIFARAQSADRDHAEVPPVAEAWAIAFDREHGHVAVKTTVPFDSARFARGTIDNRVDDCELSLGRTRGTIETGNRSIVWNLAIGPALAAAIEHLPFAKLYETPIPSSKLVTPISDARASGTLAVQRSGRSPIEHWDIESWPMMLGHNWGAQNADLYAWSHCNSWDVIEIDGKSQPGELVFEGVSARVRVGPMLSPMASAAFLRWNGERFDLNTREVVGQNRGNISLRRWEITSRSNKGIRLHAELSAETDDLVGLHYPNPRGSMTYCLNTKIARAYLEVELPNGQKLLARSNAAALEIGTKDPGHGVRMYV